MELDWISQLGFILPGIVALAWVIGNPVIIIAGYYWQDRSHDDD